MYALKKFNNVVMLTLFLTVTHILLELPHVGFENRSYKSFGIHAAYHLTHIFVQLLIIKYFFKIEKFEKIKAQ